MTSYLVDLFLCSMVVVAELVVTIILAIAIEVIFYKVFKINLYQEIWKGLNKLDRKLNRILENERRERKWKKFKKIVAM